MATWQTQIKQISMAIAVIMGLVMVLNLGLGEVVQVIVDPADAENPLDANTLAAFGGQVDFIDRVAVGGIAVTLLGSAGLGILTHSRGNPAFINTTLKYAPTILGLVAFTAFSTEVWDLLSGDRVWADYTDGANSYIAFLAASMVAGIVSLFRN